MSVVLALRCTEGRCGNLVRAHRPGFICGIDVNIVAEDGASQTERQLRDRGREQMYIAALRLTEKEGVERTYTDGAGRARAGLARLCVAQVSRICFGG